MGHQMPNLFTFNDPKSPEKLRQVIRYLEDANKCTYATPNALFIRHVYNSIDILGTYSNEVEALRKIASISLQICMNMYASRSDPNTPIICEKLVSKIIDFVNNQPWYSPDN